MNQKKMGIMGASGSGKTTLLNMAATIDKAAGGRIELDGQDIAMMSENELASFRREHLGFVFQEYKRSWPELKALLCAQIRIKLFFPTAIVRLRGFWHKTLFIRHDFFQPYPFSDQYKPCNTFYNIRALADEIYRNDREAGITCQAKS